MAGPTVARPFGVAVVLHPTWLIALAVVAWSIAAGYLPTAYPAWPAWQYWAAGLSASLLLFASVVAHELGHALVARSRGLRPDRITLFVFGGAARLDGDPGRPSDELAVALAGPAVSLAIGGLCVVATPAAALLSEVSGAVVSYLAAVNLMLALFNLLPGLPLDGGRLLRAAVWKLTGSFERGTALAAYVGQGLGYLLIATGFLRMLDGDLLGGLWTTTIGWFLGNAAESSRHQDARPMRNAGVLVAEVAETGVHYLPPSALLDEFVYGDVVRRGTRAAPVVLDGRLVGIVSVTDAGKVAPAAWCGTTVGDVMAHDLAVVRPTDDLAVAYRLMAERHVHQLPVLDPGGRLWGMVTRGNVVQWLAKAEAARRGLDAAA